MEIGEITKMMWKAVCGASNLGTFEGRNCTKTPTPVTVSACSCTNVDYLLELLGAGRAAFCTGGRGAFPRAAALGVARLFRRPFAPAGVTAAAAAAGPARLGRAMARLALATALLRTPAGTSRGADAAAEDDDEVCGPAATTAGWGPGAATTPAEVTDAAAAVLPCDAAWVSWVTLVPTVGWVTTGGWLWVTCESSCWMY